MARITLIILIALIAAAFSLSAQDSRVEEGMEQLSQGDFASAMESFDLALRYPAELQGQNLEKAYLFRAITRIYLYNTAVVRNDEKMLKELDDSYLKSYDDLKLALEHDEAGAFTARIDQELKSLYDGLVHHAISSLNEGDDLEDAAGSKEMYAKAAEYAGKALSIREDYLPHDIAGQALLKLGQDQEALGHFLDATRLFNRNKPEEPDLLIGYAYYRAALLYYYNLDDPDSALLLTKKGIGITGEEFNRFPVLSEQEMARTMKTYDQVIADLTSLEINIYLGDVKFADEASRRLKELITSNPQDYDLRVAYASILEKIDMDQAVEAYRQAIEIDTTHSIAYFNIGALYYSRAADQYAQAAETEDPAKYEMLMESARGNFLEAAPWFEWVLRLEPDNLDAIVALKNIAIMFDDAALYEKYREMEESIRQ